MQTDGTGFGVGFGIGVGIGIRAAPVAEADARLTRSSTSKAAKLFGLTGRHRV
jgi:hypothetical protein